MLFGGFWQGLPLKNTWMIDENLSVQCKANMNVGRACAPSVVLYDRYVLAIGGLIAAAKPKYSSTLNCELFDTYNNRWLQMPKTNKERSTTSACAFNTGNNSVIVYVLPGCSE